MDRPKEQEQSKEESNLPGQHTSPSQTPTANIPSKKFKKSKKKGKKGKKNNSTPPNEQLSTSKDENPTSADKTSIVPDIPSTKTELDVSVMKSNDPSLAKQNTDIEIPVEVDEVQDRKDAYQTEKSEKFKISEEQTPTIIDASPPKDSISEEAITKDFNNTESIYDHLHSELEPESEIKENLQLPEIETEIGTEPKPPTEAIHDEDQHADVKNPEIKVVKVVKEVEDNPKPQTEKFEAPLSETCQQDLVQAIEAPQDHLMTTEIQVSPGPYSLIDLIKDVPLKNLDIPESDNATITCIEAWELNIYIGTSIGEIIHMYKIDDELGYIQISRQRFSSSKLRPISRILLLPEMAKALVQCGSTVSAYVLPELSPANIGKIRDVMDMSVDYDEVQLDSNKHNYINKLDHINGDVFVKVTIFAKKSIRLIRVFDEGIKLFKDVHYPYSINGVQRSNYAAVGTYTNYDLIDLNQVQKIPLFPLTATPPNEETPKQDRMSPYIIPVGKSEFLMTCGSNNTDPAIGMVVNLNGDVSRGTLALDSYPTSLAVDFPYALSVFNGTSLKLYSLHDQSESQNITFPTNSRIQVKSVSHVFELEDKHLAKKLTRIPMISKMTPEEFEKTAIENDLALENSSVESSCIVYDELGSSVQLMKPQTRIDRLLSIYESADTRNSQLVFDELLDELKQEKDEKKGVLGKFTLTLLGLLTLKFYMFDQCFEIWCRHFKYLDPRILIYVVYGGENIQGSVWQFEGLIDKVKSVKKQYSNLDDSMNTEVEEFLKLFLNTVIDVGTFRHDAEEIVKTAEMQLLRISLTSDNSLTTLLKEIKYSSKEAVEILLLNKKYFHLAKFYEQLRDNKQFLYYWKGLITREYKDEQFDKKCPNVDKPLRYLINYLVANCTDDSLLIWKYGEWLLTSYPKFGFELFTDKHLQKIDVSDVKILNLLNNEKDIKSKYLEHMLYAKNEKQFMGDLIMADMEKLTEVLIHDNSIVNKLDSSCSKYINMNIPRMTIYKFWELEKNRFGNNELPLIMENIYKNLGLINKDTISVLGQENVVDACLKVLSAPTFKNRFPLLEIILYFKKANYKQVVSSFCDMQDFTTAELFATTLRLPLSISTDSYKVRKEQELALSPEQQRTSELLLMQIFDVYLRMNHSYLIESFLNSYNLLQVDTATSNSVLDKMDKFVELLERVPNSFPLSQLQGFLIRSIIDFQDNSDELLMTKNLTKSYNSGTNRFLGTIETGKSDEIGNDSVSK